jgi:hypothetical protein
MKKNLKDPDARRLHPSIHSLFRSAVVSIHIQRPRALTSAAALHYELLAMAGHWMERLFGSLK